MYLETDLNIMARRCLPPIQHNNTSIPDKNALFSSLRKFTTIVKKRHCEKQYVVQNQTTSTFALPQKQHEGSYPNIS